MVSWGDLFDSPHFAAKEAVALARVRETIAEGDTVYPVGEAHYSPSVMRRSIYRALELTPLNEVKVVILGQDPYHGPGQANGLAFSVAKGVPLPPSLRNIFKELHADLGDSLRTDGDLIDWARQGVLLLNSSLTVVEGQPNSMSDLWAPVTDEIIRFVDRHMSPVVFVLWGNNARSKRELITRNAGLIVESAHPSPLSASRGFFGSKPFSRVNWLLTLYGLEPIIWR